MNHPKTHTAIHKHTHTHTHTHTYRHPTECFMHDCFAVELTGDGHFFPSYHRLYLSSFSDTLLPAQRRSLQMLDSGVPTPLFRGSSPMRAGGPGVLPREFFSFKAAEPLNFNSQAARLMPLSDHKTKGTITLKYSAVHKRFTPHSYWEVIRWAK